MNEKMGKWKCNVWNTSLDKDDKILSMSIWENKWGE